MNNRVNMYADQEEICQSGMISSVNWVYILFKRKQDKSFISALLFLVLVFN